MSIYEDADKRLKETYGKWIDELSAECPWLLSDGYSNPYFTCVPKGWFDSGVRILVVGEEGNGSWGRGKSDGVMPDEIQKIQTFCWSSLSSYLDYERAYSLYPDAEEYRKIYSPFWTRARELSKRGVCAWTDIDLIHRINGKSRLNDREREALHSPSVKVIKEEIGILKPTHVVFSGWYGISLKQDLPELFVKLYPNGLGDNSVWKNNVLCFEIDGVYYICAYHPNWGCRKKGYEAEVLRLVDEKI